MSVPSKMVTNLLKNISFFLRFGGCSWLGYCLSYHLDIYNSDELHFIMEFVHSFFLHSQTVLIILNIKYAVHPNLRGSSTEVVRPFI